MRGNALTARTLITSKNTALSTVRLQPKTSTTVQTNARERRIQVSFGTANIPVSVSHNLGFAPSAYTVLGQTGAGTVYNDLPLPSTSRVIVLKCDTANVVADILVR